MWAAAMQACIAAVNCSLNVSMVLSGKMVWFVRLVLEDSVCYVEITNGRRVDGKGFLKDRVQFLRYAKDHGTLSEKEKDKWDVALAAILDDDEPVDGDS